jgi:hypothetical protein
MAQKKRKEEEKKEAQYEFIPPSFDEKDFLEKDIRATKVTLLSSIWGLVFGVVVGLLNGPFYSLLNSLSPYVGLLILLLGIYLLKFFFQWAKIDTKEIDKKGWLGNYAMFFFLFLGIWILLINAPFVTIVR